MSDTQKQVCWIALDREVAEAWKSALTHTENRSANEDAALEACRKSLVTECAEGVGEVGKLRGESVLDRTETELPVNFATGPCRVIVIAGERDG